MIARGLKRRWQFVKNALTLMFDHGGFAVHELGRAHDGAAVGLGDALVAQTHPEDRDLAAVLAHELKRDAGFVGRARPGRDDDMRGR